MIMPVGIPIIASQQQIGIRAEAASKKESVLSAIAELASQEKSQEI